MKPTMIPITKARKTFLFAYVNKTIILDKILLHPENINKKRIIADQ